VHNAGLVRRSQRGGHLHGNFQGVVQIHSLTRQRGAQSYTLDELCRDEVAVSLRADLVNRQNVRMIQCRGTARLGFEPAQLRLIRRQVLWKKLKRDFAPEPLVSGEVDLAHPAHTEQ